VPPPRTDSAVVRGGCGLHAGQLLEREAHLDDGALTNLARGRFYGMRQPGARLLTG